MLLYHGSNLAVEEPKLLASERRLDFGSGFYLTSSFEQASRWAVLTAKRRGQGNPRVSAYELSEDRLTALNVLEFDSASLAWLEYVGANRSGNLIQDEWDVVIGPVANDTTMPTLRLFFANVLTAQQTIENLLPARLKDQYAFKTQRAIDLLGFKEAIEA